MAACDLTYMIIGLVTILLSFLWFRSATRRRNQPPGPWGLPIVGNFPFLGKNPTEAFDRYRREYGDVFSLKMGSYEAVVLNGLETIKTALTKRPDDFGGRPLVYSFQLMSDQQNGNVGLSIPFGPRWKLLRKVTNNALRTFANYRTNPVEDIIVEEGDRLVNFLLSQNTKPVNPSDEIMLCVGSVLYQILFGRNSNIREDKQYCAMIKSSRDFVEFANVGNPVDIMPWTRLFFRDKTKQFLQIIERPYKVSAVQQKEHLETYDRDSIRDVMDALLASASDLTREEREEGSLSKELVMSTTVDLLGAGVDTIGTSLLWAVYFMVQYPDIQSRVQREIDQYVGTSRPPSMEDKKDLKFVEATVLEIMRLSSMVPLSIPRQTTVDVNLNGYTIPEGTFVIINQASTCMDPTVWGDPDTFRPDRFLKTDETGEVSIDRELADSFMAFGAGRRRCIGEFLAKVELFLFFSLLMQRCDFSTVQGEDYSNERVFGLTVKPNSYNVVVTERV